MNIANIIKDKYIINKNITKIRGYCDNNKCIEYCNHGIHCIEFIKQCCDCKNFFCGCCITNISSRCILCISSQKNEDKKCEKCGKNIYLAICHECENLLEYCYFKCRGIGFEVSCTNCLVSCEICKENIHSKQAKSTTKFHYIRQF